MDPKFPNPEDELAAFQTEIAALREAETSGGVETSHLSDREGFGIPAGRKFNPAELTTADFTVWQGLKDGTLTREQYAEYKRKLPRHKENYTRAQFGSLLENRVTPYLARREPPELLSHQDSQ